MASLPLPSDCGKNRKVLLPPLSPLVVTSAPPLSELEAAESSRNSPDPLLNSLRVSNGLGSSSSPYDPAAQPLQSPKSSTLQRPCRCGCYSTSRGSRNCGSSRTSTAKEISAWCRLLAVLRCMRSIVLAVAMLIAACLATLVAFWSLFPVCTACKRIRGGSLATETAGIADGSRVAPYSTLRINQLQVIGTHNSYHRRTMLGLWPYHFPSLTEQLDAGVRHLELDVHYDWKTGRWFVYHISVVDPLSTCSCLLTCLDEIRVWSDRNPMHHILFIDVELKLTGDFLRICGEHTPDADRTAFINLQNTVLDAFPPERVLVPSQVRGEYPTIFEAVQAGGSCSGEACGGVYNSSAASSGGGSTSASWEGVVPGVAGGWPRVDDTRGMVVFVMDYQTVNMNCRDEIRKTLPVEDTVFFERIPTYEVRKNSPYAAFTQACQCTNWWRGRVQMLVNQGFIVRQHPENSQWVDDERKMLRASSLLMSNETYLADTPAQLLVSDDLLHVGTSGVCRSRCTPQVPEEECILEGFC